MQQLTGASRQCAGPPQVNRRVVILPLLIPKKEKRRRLTPGELNLVNHSDKPALILEGLELVEKPVSGNDNHLVSVAIELPVAHCFS